MFRADNARRHDSEGTGLGLYIVKSIATNAKGKAWFESEENKGTTFFVQLPLLTIKHGNKRKNNISG
jgi:signal transduction histidine kinase